jgi:uncharacterized phage protein gp47/JayE
MGPVTPSIRQINTNIISQIEAAIGQAVPILPKAFIRVMAKTLAAVFVLLWKYAGFIFLQMFVKTATLKYVEINGQMISPLREWGSFVGVGDPIPAEQAVLTIDIVVKNQTGSLPATTQIVDSATGVTYLLVGSVALDAETVQGSMRAAGDQGGGNGAGTIGNAEPGAIMSFAGPVGNVSNDVIVAGTNTLGADEEAEDTYRDRIIDRFRKRPQGGALLDYEVWGRLVGDVEEVFPYRADLGGEVDVFVLGTLAAFPPDGIPSQAVLDEVEAAIILDDLGLASRKPAGSWVNVHPIRRTAFDVVVYGIRDVENLSDTQTQIEAALSGFFRAREPYVAGVTVGPRTDTLTNSSITAVVSDIVTAANGTFDGVGFVIEGESTTLFVYTLDRDELAKLAAVNYSL